MAGTFQAGGLASGLDTNSIVDSLVALQRKPIEKLETAKKVVDVKVSALAQLTTKLKAFDAAVRELASKGARGFTIASAPASLGVAVNSSASAGRYSLEVTSLAQAAKARSTGFVSGETVQGSTLKIEADGASYDVTIASGSTLEQAAAAITASGAPISASVVDDGTKRYLTLTRTSTGFAIGDTPASALTITEKKVPGGGGQLLGLSTVVAASNAHVKVDGLDIERRTNTLEGVLPGVTLTAQKLTSGPETLVIADDTAATKTALQKVVDAYNEVIKSVQGELDLEADTDRTKTLGGEPAVRSLQARLQGLLVREVGTGDLRTLADLGVRTARDGSLSIDAATFDRAMARDPAGVDELFDGGLASFASAVADAFADSTSGAFSLRSKGLTAEKRRIDERIEVLEARAERYRDLLISRFAAMEKLVSSSRAIGSFLTSQESNRTKE